MTRKILSVSVKTKDDKGHVKFWKTHEIDLGSIKFKVDQKSEPKPKKEPKQETKKDPKKDPK